MCTWISYIRPIYARDNFEVCEKYCHPDFVEVRCCIFRRCRCDIYVRVYTNRIRLTHKGATPALTLPECLPEKVGRTNSRRYKKVRPLRIPVNPPPRHPLMITVTVARVGMGCHHPTRISGKTSVSLEATATLMSRVKQAE